MRLNEDSRLAGFALCASRRRDATLQGDWSSDVCSFFPSRRRHTRLQGDWSSDVCSSYPSRRRHTRLQGDWSSDVCSSDLPSADTQWSVEGGFKQRVEREFDGRYLTGQTRTGAVSWSIEAIYD